jgi:hypothetical protein
MLYMDFWDGKNMDIISLIHIWHHFSFGLLFLDLDGCLQEIVAGSLPYHQ